MSNFACSAGVQLVNLRKKGMHVDALLNKLVHKKEQYRQD